MGRDAPRKSLTFRPDADIFIMGVADEGKFHRNGLCARAHLTIIGYTTQTATCR
jgi:hypothetical protein